MAEFAVVWADYRVASGASMFYEFNLELKLARRANYGVFVFIKLHAFS